MPSASRAFCSNDLKVRWQLVQTFDFHRKHGVTPEKNVGILSTLQLRNDSAVNDGVVVLLDLFEDDVLLFGELLVAVVMSVLGLHVEDEKNWMRDLLESRLLSGPVLVGLEM